MSADPGRRLHDELLGRARDAAGGMATHCAWCGRLRVAGGWVDAELVPEDASHGICPDCVEALRRSGRSR